MKRLCDELGNPQRDYATLHVVGTNGKSSVTSMAAAILHAHGLRTGSCLSPHAWRWSERTSLDGAEIEPEPFAAAVAEVAEAVERVEADDDRVTQFEAAIATSFVAFARAGVDAAVIEAGLGGRLDATNVIDSRATALTSVGLDHTQWLGETELEIAGEKLAVLRPGTALVLGDLSAEVERLARATAANRDAEVISPEPLDEALLPGGIAPYLRRNAAVAAALARVLVPGLEPAAIAAGLAAASLPGRAESLGGDPPLLADAAHNEQGARALAEALPALTGGRPAVGCLSILEDKDRERIVAALAPALSAAVCTAAEPGPAMGRPGARAADPAELAWLLEAQGVGAEVVADPGEAVERTLTLAAERGGVAICAGSHYLLRYAWTARHVQNYSR
jgi:dihydrofolate synthase/folylpolyglutamate synthase